MISMEREQVFWAVTDALWVVSDAGLIIRANDAILKLLDKSLVEVIGKKMFFPAGLFSLPAGFLSAGYF